MSIPDSDRDNIAAEGDSDRDGDTPVVEDAIVVDRAEPDKATGPGKTGNAMAEEPAVTGWRGRLFSLADRFAFLALKAVIFGLIAATVGILAAVLLRNQAELEGSASITADLAQRDQQIESIGGEVSELAGQIALLAGQDTVAALSESVEQTAGQNARLRTDIDALAATLGEQVGELQARISEIEQLQPITADSLSEMSVRLDALTGDLQRLEEVSLAMAQATPPVQPQPAEPAGEGRIEARLLMLDQRIGSLEKERDMPTAGLADQSGLDALDARLSAIEAGGNDDGQMLARLEQAESRLAILEARQTGDDDLARSLALVAVRAAVETGAPYLLLLRDGGFADAEIPEVVMIHAETGVESLTDLRQGFARIAEDALRADMAESREQGGLAGLIGTLVQVRPLEPGEGDDIAHVLARAETLLNGDDLAGALQTLSPATGPAREALADWIEVAEARLAVLTAINTMLTRPDMAP